MSDTAGQKAQRDKASQAEVDQAAAETAEQAGAGSADPASADPAPAKPDLDEVKRKFRAALDRKREVNTDDGAGGGGRDGGKIHGTHGPAAGRRSFRRKSG